MQTIREKAIEAYQEKVAKRDMEIEKRKQENFEDKKAFLLKSLKRFGLIDKKSDEIVQTNITHGPLVAIEDLPFFVSIDDFHISGFRPFIILMELGQCPKCSGILHHTIKRLEDVGEAITKTNAQVICYRCRTESVSWNNKGKSCKQ